METERWSDLLPAMVRYQPKLVGDDQGARPHWQRAISQIVDAEELDWLSGVDDDGDCRRQDCPSCVPISREDRAARMDRIVAANQQALASFRAGIAAGRFRTPVELPYMGTQLDEIQGLRSLIRIACIQATRLAEGGEPDAAALALVDVLSSGRLLLDSECLVVGCLIGFALIGVGVIRVQELLDRHRLSAQTLGEIRRTVSGIDFYESYAEAIRAELARLTLPTLDLFDRAWADRPADALAKHYCSVSSEAMAAEFGWRPEQIIEVLKGHSHPFDADEMVRILALQAAEFVADCVAPEQLAEVQAELTPYNRRLDLFHDIWPPEFSSPVFEIPSDTGDETAGEVERAVRESLRQQNASVRRLSEERLRAVKEQLRVIANPLGLALGDQLAIGVGRQAIDRFPATKELVTLRRRLDDLEHPSLQGRLREWRRRWLRRRPDRANRS